MKYNIENMGTAFYTDLCSLPDSSPFHGMLHAILQHT